MLASPRTFACPNCKEIINDSMTQCRFCSVPVDPNVAQLIANRRKKQIMRISDFKSARRSWWISLAMLLGVPVIFVIE